MQRKCPHKQFGALNIFIEPQESEDETKSLEASSFNQTKMSEIARRAESRGETEGDLNEILNLI